MPAGAGADGHRQPAPRGVVNVTRARVSADGARGLPGEAPFDVIVLSGSVAEVPPALLAQLKLGGRLVAIVGELPVMRALLYHARGRRRLVRARPVRHRGAAPARLRRAHALSFLTPACRTVRLRRSAAGPCAWRRHVACAYTCQAPVPHADALSHR